MKFIGTEITLLNKLHRSKEQMEKDLDANDLRKYPPLYSKDYVFGKLQTIKEIINLLE